MNLHNFITNIQLENIRQMKSETPIRIQKLTVLLLNCRNEFICNFSYYENVNYISSSGGFHTLPLFVFLYENTSIFILSRCVGRILMITFTFKIILPVLYTFSL